MLPLRLPPLVHLGLEELAVELAHDDRSKDVVAMVDGAIVCKGPSALSSSPRSLHVWPRLPASSNPDTLIRIPEAGRCIENLGNQRKILQ